MSTIITTLDNLAIPVSLSVKINKDYDAQPPYFFALDGSDKLENSSTKNGVISQFDDSYMQRSNLGVAANIVQVQTVSAAAADSDNSGFIAKFYMGSITVVGLYIFYRMLVKNMGKP